MKSGRNNGKSNIIIKSSSGERIRCHCWMLMLYTLLQPTHSHWQHISSFRRVHRIVLLAAAAALSYYATRHRCQCDAKHRREELRRSRPQTVFTFSLYYFILCALRICWTLATLFYADEMNIVGIHSLTIFFSISKGKT